MYKALIFVGPTAVGKSSIAEKYAKLYSLPVVSADSRQIYKELNIGVAKPGASDLAAVNYFEINSCLITEENNVALYCDRVRNILNSIQSDVIIVGGTGLYIKSLMEGIDELPPKNEVLRKELTTIHDNKGIDGLQKEYAKLRNPYPIKDTKNPNRLMRAIEMGEKNEAGRIEAPLKNFECHLIGLQMERRVLYNRINERVDSMVQEGLVNEVKSLYIQRHLSSLQTVGYQELFNYFDGEFTLDFAIDKIKQHTRNYAKRQITYFNNQLNVHWFNANETEKLDTFVSNIL